MRQTTDHVPGRAISEYIWRIYDISHRNVGSWLDLPNYPSYFSKHHWMIPNYSGYSRIYRRQVHVHAMTVFGSVSK